MADEVQVANHFLSNQSLTTIFSEYTIAIFFAWELGKSMYKATGIKLLKIIGDAVNATADRIGGKDKSDAPEGPTPYGSN